MLPNDVNSPEQDLSGAPDMDNLRTAEQELLARVRDLAQQIVERVNKALSETGTHSSLPTEEKPSLPPSLGDGHATGR
jgi:hypothetical protein